MYVQTQYLSNLTTIAPESAYAICCSDTLQVPALTYPQHLRLRLPPTPCSLHAIDTPPGLSLTSSSRHTSRAAPDPAIKHLPLPLRPDASRRDVIRQWISSTRARHGSGTSSRRSTALVGHAVCDGARQCLGRDVCSDERRMDAGDADAVPVAVGDVRDEG